MGGIGGRGMRGRGEGEKGRIVRGSVRRREREEMRGSGEEEKGRNGRRKCLHKPF